MIKSIFFFCLIQQIERKLASEVNQISVTPQCAYSFFAPSKKISLIITRNLDPSLTFHFVVIL